MSIFDGSVELSKFSVQQAVGRTVTCLDGKRRRVVEIVPAHSKPWLSLINEGDSDSKGGHFVHNLTLACELMGKAPPTREQREAFERVIGAMDYNEPRNRQERQILQRRIEVQRAKARGFRLR